MVSMGMNGILGHKSEQKTTKRDCISQQRVYASISTWRAKKIKTLKKKNQKIAEIKKQPNLLSFNKEPLGAKKPTLQFNDFKRSWIERPAKNTFALFCPVEAFPMPSFR